MSLILSIPRRLLESPQLLQGKCNRSPWSAAGCVIIRPHRRGQRRVEDGTIQRANADRLRQATPPPLPDALCPADATARSPFACQIPFSGTRCLLTRNICTVTQPSFRTEELGHLDPWHSRRPHLRSDLSEFVVVDRLLEYLRDLPERQYPRRAQLGSCSPPKFRRP